MNTFTTMRESIGSRVLAVVGTIAMVFAFGAIPATTSAQAQSCGLDIAIVIDSSGSIGGEMGNVKSAFQGFVNDVLVGDNEMTAIDFDGTATLIEDWTTSQGDMNAAIGGISSGGNTNWEAAIDTAAGQFPHRSGNTPDVMIFASDGDPNESDSGGGALADAVTAADAAKADGIYIKSVGIGDGINGSNLEAISSDGSYIDSDFDQLANDLEDLAAQLCEEVGGNGGDVTVINGNKGFVGNKTSASANTGGNVAGGSHGGSGGRGGDVSSTIRQEGSADDNNTGNGGNGGNGGTGGTVNSGDAYADAMTTNTVGSNVTRINRCNCAGGDVTVGNFNHGTVLNYTGASAGTGYNAALGSVGGSGGRGGDVATNSGDADDNRTGDGGRGGAGSRGGSVNSGNATSWATTVNTVGSNFTRVR